MHQEHDIFMQEAVMLSQKCMESGIGGPFGCVVVKNGEIIGRGSNCVVANNDPTAHAEITAIRAACKYLGTYQLHGCIIYTSTEPCPMCMGAIYWSRPDKVYYANTRQDAARCGFDDSLIYEQLALPLQERKIPMIAWDNKEAIKVFEKWMQYPEREEY